MYNVLYDDVHRCVLSAVKIKMMMMMKMMIISRLLSMAYHFIKDTITQQPKCDAAPRNCITIDRKSFARLTMAFSLVCALHSTEVNSVK